MIVSTLISRYLNTINIELVFLVKYQHSSKTEPFVKIKPFKVLVEKVEIQELSECVVLGWLKIKECHELREIHLRLCKELKNKFNIEPLGFDGDMWRFHSTLVCSTVDKGSMIDIISDYHNKDISMEFEPKEGVMFCCLGDTTNDSQWFSLKKFNIGNKF